MLDILLTSIVSVVIQGIHISLLELNTFGHAMCALLIYLLWWEKPFDVDYPPIVRSQTLWSVCALVWMQNFKSGFSISVNNDYKTYLKNNKRFDALPKVSLCDEITAFWCR